MVGISRSVQITSIRGSLLCAAWANRISAPATGPVTLMMMREKCSRASRMEAKQRAKRSPPRQTMQTRVGIAVAMVSFDL